ncbi:MAG: anthranilate phosphoribosyltransferase [Candidatus Lokiarchaeota archaeon]|nr:anthranilate phosphoribosyltransferase [Candidatus Lokiarchaeota archaeon]
MEEETIVNALRKITCKENLSIYEAENVMRDIMTGKVQESQLGAFLTGLSMKGESSEEITGFARIMREFSSKINPAVEGELLDTCGTGGDKIKTFNISTISALVVAGAGVPVAKHGNRAVTSKCGSADILEGLGVKINLPPEGVRECIEKVGIGFMFAPLFHPAMKHAMPTRRALKIRTVFNILGPLTNPASAKYHILGVFQKELAPLMANVLNGLGTKHAFTVYNSLGIDEIAPVGINYVTEITDGKIESYAITSQEFNLPQYSAKELLSGTMEENLKIAIKILHNRVRDAKYDTVLMNAALALKSANKASDFSDAVSIARNSIESGNAMEKLKHLVEISGGEKEKLNNLL